MILHHFRIVVNEVFIYTRDRSKGKDGIFTNF